MQSGTVAYRELDGIWYGCIVQQLDKSTAQIMYLDDRKIELHCPISELKWKQTEAVSAPYFVLNSMEVQVAKTIFQYLNSIDTLKCTLVSKAWKKALMRQCHWETLDFTGEHGPVDTWVTALIHFMITSNLHISIPMKYCIISAKFDHSAVGNEGVLAVLRNCPKLEEISLSSCPNVTDQVLIEMEEYKLHSVNLFGCPKLSIQQVHQLQRRQPHLQISLPELVMFTLCPTTMQQFHINTQENSLWIFEKHDLLTNVRTQKEHSDFLPVVEWIQQFPSKWIPIFYKADVQTFYMLHDLVDIAKEMVERPHVGDKQMLQKVIQNQIKSTPPVHDLQTRTENTFQQLTTKRAELDTHAFLYEQHLRLISNLT